MFQCREQEAFEGWFLGLHGPRSGLSNEFNGFKVVSDGWQIPPTPWPGQSCLSLLWLKVALQVLPGMFCWGNKKSLQSTDQIQFSSLDTGSWWGSVTRSYRVPTWATSTGIQLSWLQPYQYIMPACDRLWLMLTPPLMSGALKLLVRKNDGHGSSERR